MLKILHEIIDSNKAPLFLRVYCTYKQLNAKMLILFLVAVREVESTAGHSAGDGELHCIQCPVENAP